MPRRRIFHLRDPETGEIRDWEHSIPAPRNRRKGYVQLWLDDLVDIDFTVTDIKVLAAIRPNIVPSTGVFSYSPEDLAEKLGYTGPNRKQQASNAIAHAVRIGLFRRLGRTQLQINPRIMWNGDPRDASVANYVHKLDQEEET